MDDTRLRIEYMELGALLRTPENPKSHNDAAIAASIRKRGFNDPFCIDERTGQLVEGHGRLTALEALKAAGRPAPGHIVTEGGKWLAPVVRGVSFANDDEAMEYIVGHNQMTMGGGWNERLAPILERAMRRKVPAGMLGFAGDQVARILAEHRDRVAAGGGAPTGAPAGGGTGGDPGEGRYKAQFGVIVICEDEGQQERVYKQLAAEGYQCRVVVT